MAWLERGAKYVKVTKMFDEFKMRIYVRIQYSWLSVRIIQPHLPAKQYENDTNVIIQTPSKGDSKIISVSKQASDFSSTLTANTRFGNAFDHPRTVIKDFGLAHVTLKHFVQLAYGKKLVFHGGIMVIHPQDRLEGGLSEVEFRAMREMGLMAGARDAFVYALSPELTDEQILGVNRNSEIIDMARQPLAW